MPHAAGQLFVVSAPSGVGKTTIVRAVMPRWPGLRFSVSSTTRPPREGEVHGRDYYFLSDEEFEGGIRSGRFLEWAEVHGRYYGTDGDRIREWLEAGADVLLDIDVQGAAQVRCAYPEANTIFILPPSMAILEERLRKRGTESQEQLDKRLSAATREIRQAPWYDFIVVNDVLEEAIEDFSGIIRACRLRNSAQVHRVVPLLPVHGL
ncbi:MAG: guanylate kinase [Acidobacteriota bacterium]